MCNSDSSLYPVGYQVDSSIITCSTVLREQLFTHLQKLFYSYQFF